MHRRKTDPAIPKTGPLLIQHYNNLIKDRNPLTLEDYLFLNGTKIPSDISIVNANGANNSNQQQSNIITNEQQTHTTQQPLFTYNANAKDGDPLFF